MWSNVCRWGKFWAQEIRRDKKNPTTTFEEHGAKIRVLCLPPFTPHHQKVRVSVSQLCPTLCNSMDWCSPPGSSVHGILQARILEWVTIPASPGHLPDPVIEPVVSRIAGGFFNIWVIPPEGWEKYLGSPSGQPMDTLLPSPHIKNELLPPGGVSKQGNLLLVFCSPLH